MQKVQTIRDLLKAEFSAIKNVLRYFPPKLHTELAEEFKQELKQYGHIYCYRYRPTKFEIKPYPQEWFPAACQKARCIMVMIFNNLSDDIAQHPDELITYGGNGSVFSNWAQFNLIMYYLTRMTEEQTLVMYSGHPHGLFPSKQASPRLVISNGMVIPNYSSKALYEKFYALGVTQYGQMTAGSYCYIGPQGIVHGTTLTILNAGRKYLKHDSLRNKGVCFVSSGLGGMSGAQAKAGKICGVVAVIAEIDPIALKKRHDQGWVDIVTRDVVEVVKLVKAYKAKNEGVSIGYGGNIVDLWEHLAEEKEMICELGSDQTSLHNPLGGGYYPVQLSFEKAKTMMFENPKRFEELVRESLVRQVAAINKLTKRGMKFWDYGNCFLLEASRSNADVFVPDLSAEEKKTNPKFKYPSYVEDIMGDIFSLGFGPFRWVCCSGKEEDLDLTDKIAGDVIEELMKNSDPVKDKRIIDQYSDNLLWIRDAKKNKLVVGSQARILYCGYEGRRDIALRFNQAIKEGKLKGPVVLSRDHHDVSGTDSPFRETSNITDGSRFCADMAIQNVIGGGMRGATWVAIHNGGGVGWGEVVNGGFGFVLDGTKEAKELVEAMLFWDVNNGVTRRAWAGNDNAMFEVQRIQNKTPQMEVTIPFAVNL